MRPISDPAADTARRALFATSSRIAAPDASTHSGNSGRRWRRNIAIGGWSSAIATVLALLGGQPSAAGTGSPSDLKAGPDTEDPCDGLFAVMDRPTIADSACSVKPGRLLTELGYTRGTIKGSDTARIANFPQAALRYGLPDGWELRLFPPTYNMAEVSTATGPGRVEGLGDAAFGAKYQVGTFSGFTVAIDARLTVPSGKHDFSSGGVQGNVQTMVSYSLTPKFGLLFQLGASSLTNRVDNGQVARFGSLGANLVLGYQITDRLQVFSELFGNSKSGPTSRGNLSTLGGVQFLLTEAVEIDLGAGVLLTGPQGQQGRFFQIGTGLLF